MEFKINIKEFHEILMNFIELQSIQIHANEFKWISMNRSKFVYNLLKDSSFMWIQVNEHEFTDIPKNSTTEFNQVHLSLMPLWMNQFLRCLL